MSNILTPAAVSEVAQSHGITPALLDTIFNTVAKEAKTPEERILTLEIAKRLGLDLLKREMHVGRIKGTLVPIADFRTFLARTRKAGWTMYWSAVCAKDTWGGFDAKNRQPLEHVQHPTERGPIIGAWVVAEHATCPRVGVYWPIGELRNSGNFLESGMQIYLVEKRAVTRLARMICPDLGGLYEATEVDSAPPDASAAKPEVIRPLRTVEVPSKAPAQEAKEQPAPVVENQVLAGLIDSVRAHEGAPYFAAVTRNWAKKHNLSNISAATEGQLTTLLEHLTARSEEESEKAQKAPSHPDATPPEE